MEFFYLKLVNSHGVHIFGPLLAPQQSQGPNETLAASTVQAL